MVNPNIFPRNNIYYLQPFQKHLSGKPLKNVIY